MGAYQYVAVDNGGKEIAAAARVSGFARVDLRRPDETVICAGCNESVTSTEVSEPLLTKASATLRLILSVRLD